MAKILIACEESQTVTKEFRKLGHDAYSCDVLQCSGDHPEWHFQQDVVPLLKQRWDMIIAHPPCTYLANSGVSWLTGKKAQKGRWEKMKEGAEFFKLFLNNPCEKIAIENPIMHKYAVKIIGRKHDQLVQPYMFGHLESKATCFWLKGIKKLEHTWNRKEEMQNLPKREKQRLHYLPPSQERARLRSKTFIGIAKAMAEQWGQ